MNILIVGPSWVGDMVMAQTLFKCLHQEHPGCHIDVLAPDWSRPILERMPEVRAALSLPLGHGALALKTRYKIGRSLINQYDQAIILPNSLKSALIPFFANIKKRTGWKGEMRYLLLNDLRKLDKQAYPLMIERFMALAYPKNQPLPTPYPKPRLQINNQLQKNALQRFNLNTTQPILALCPGAEFGEAKKWPANYYANIANNKIQMGWQVWVFGSKNDHSVGEAIRNQLAQSNQEQLINLAGKTSLAEAIDLLAHTQAVITNDSGLMHVAAAVDKPIVAVYGSTSPQFTPPLSDKVAIVRLDLECSPCFQRTCKFGHYHCLKQLEPSQVESALDDLIAKEHLE